METYQITLLELKTDTEMHIQVNADEAETSENIIIYCKIKETEITAKSYGYLTAYQQFRDKLLVLGYGVKCNGSRLNAVQSGMMVATDKIYLVEMGKQALAKDIAYIWDYADIDVFADTKQQSLFYEQWIESLN